MKVDKNRFLKIVQDYTATTPEDAEALASLRTRFPYSQVIQTLAARAGKDHGLPNQQSTLQIAAVYAADRALLKEIIMQAPRETVHQVVSHQADADAEAARTVDDVDVADVVMGDLDRLARLKDTFENLFMETVEPAAAPQTQDQDADVPDSPKEDAGTAGKEELEVSPIKSKKERIIEMAKAMNASPASESSESKKKPRSKDGNPVDELIDEIAHSKSEMEPGSETQKQQNQIIDQFIAVQPSISNPRDRIPAPVADLTSIKTGEFGDNIVSETLAEILIKQGKKDRAIEVLKKLIWKYPQKKAYFASRIESLKK